MGCDIHLVVEKRRVKKGWFRHYQPQPNSKEDKKILKQDILPDKEWSSCLITRNGTWGDRLYSMFAILADVRNYGDREHIPLRGFPKDASMHTIFEYAREVVHDSDYKEDDSRNTVSESRASEWIRDGWSKEIPASDLPKFWREIKLITDPDYHSPNWCSLKELEDAIQEVFYEKEVDDYVLYADEWLGLLYYMKGLEKAGYETRCVFWFDN